MGCRGRIYTLKIAVPCFQGSPMFILQRIPPQIDFLLAGFRMFFTIPQ